MVMHLSAKAQQDGNLYRFYDKETGLSGYKDARGKIKTPAKFGGLTSAAVFRNIIAVAEPITNSSYYLLRSGKKAGAGSLYVWDMSYDCEQEGKIRFHDPKTDKIGFFGNDGKVRIAAVYNDARPFYNGLALVVHHGKRICADGKPFDPKSPCEHWAWNGITALIDSGGRIVADSLDMNKTANLNWYSLQISDRPAVNPLTTSFKGKQGGYYSFINYEKEFKQWFYGQYLNGPDLQKYAYRQVSVEGLSGETPRKFYKKGALMKQYGSLLASKMNAIKKGLIETELISEKLNPLIYSQADFKPFYTDCDEANTNKYPAFDMVTSHYNKQRQVDYQEQFSFLRTANGYRLIGVALKK